ncbi:hypothetical protein [Variovorax sp. LT1R16]|uniref:hypothetical protein n=1 Tax=Variovorax sp. LT1R16 TaxID=3443728 RepID=UPI003F452C1F
MLFEPLFQRSTPSVYKAGCTSDFPAWLATRFQSGYVKASPTSAESAFGCAHWLRLAGRPRQDACAQFDHHVAKPADIDTILTLMASHLYSVAAMGWFRSTSS